MNMENGHDVCVCLL